MDIRPYLKNLTIDDHAVLRAKERFKSRDKKSALHMCRCYLGTAQYMGETVCEKGHPAHMFTSGKAAIYISLDLKRIKTIIKVEPKSYIAVHQNEQENPLFHKLKSLYEKELKRHEREERWKEKRLRKAETEFGVEIATLKLRMIKTRSASVRIACQSRLSALEQQIVQDYKEPLVKIQSDKRKITRAMMSLY